jgi:hypothetical protein
MTETHGHARWHQDRPDGDPSPRPAAGTDA